MTDEKEIVEVELSNEERDIEMTVKAPRKTVDHISLDDVFTCNIVNYDTVEVDHINTK